MAQFTAAVVAAYVAGLRDAELVAVIVCSMLLSVALVVADALIRRGRAGVVATGIKYGAIEEAPAPDESVEGVDA